MIFLDSNVVMELLNDDPAEAGGWAETALAQVAGQNVLACNLIVVAEVAAGLARPDQLPTNLANTSVDVVELDLAAALRAAAAFRMYRDRGGPRSTILPDFLIAAHAEVLGARLMTRDRRLASYFPDLVMITPETHPNG